MSQISQRSRWAVRCKRPRRRRTLCSLRSQTASLCVRAGRVPGCELRDRLMVLRPHAALATAIAAVFRARLSRWMYGRRSTRLLRKATCLAEVSERAATGADAAYELQLQEPRAENHHTCGAALILQTLQTGQLHRVCLLAAPTCQVRADMNGMVGAPRHMRGQCKYLMHSTSSGGTTAFAGLTNCRPCHLHRVSFRLRNLWIHLRLHPHPHHRLRLLRDPGPCAERQRLGQTPARRWGHSAPSGQPCRG